MKILHRHFANTQNEVPSSTYQITMCKNSVTTQVIQHSNISK